MLECISTGIMAVGGALLIYEDRHKNERLRRIGWSLVFIGGVPATIAHRIEENSIENARRVALTSWAIDTATPEATPTIFFVTARPQHTLTPTQTETATPSSTPTETRTPTETPSPTPTLTPILEMIPVGLDQAKAVCHKEDYPDWLFPGFVSVQIGNEIVLMDCVEAVGLDDRTVEFAYTVNKDGRDYSSYSYVTVYIPITLFDDGKYALSIPECDDKCTLSLIDAGGVQVGDALEAPLGGTTTTMIVENDGYCDGFVMLTIADVGGGQTGKFRVTKIND